MKKIRTTLWILISFIFLWICFCSFAIYVNIFTRLNYLPTISIHDASWWDFISNLNWEKSYLKIRNEAFWYTKTSYKRNEEKIAFPLMDCNGYTDSVLLREYAYLCINIFKNVQYASRLFLSTSFWWFCAL